MIFWLVACDAEQTAPTKGDAPEIHTVTLSPDAPTTNTVLTATVSLTTEAEVTLRHVWRVDGVTVGDDGPNLDGAAWFAAGQTVEVEVVAVGEDGESVPATSPAVTVANSAPTVGVTVSPTSPTALVDTLTCTATAADDDDDALMLSYAWTRDGAAVGTEATLAPTLAGTYTCTVTADDAEAAGVGSATVVVAEPTVAALDPWVEPDTWIDPPAFTPGTSVTVWHHEAGVDKVVLRYGFDGWTRTDGVIQQSETDSQGMTIWWSEIDLIQTSEGVWSVGVGTPAGIVAMHAELVVDGEARTNDGRQWHASSEFPFVAPYLSWTDTVGPRDGVVVSWEANVPSWGVVAWGTTDALGNYVVGDTWSTLHHVPLTGLPQGARVYYRVYDSAGHESPLYDFLTLADGETDLEFLVAADMQDNAALTDRWPEVAEAMREAAPDARFLIVPGDLTSTDRPGHWWRYFYDGRDLFPNLPMMPVPGNHDTRIEEDDADFRSFTEWFALPGEERYYSFDYGNLRMIGFDTESYAEMAYGGAQYSWAEALLATTDPGWVFGYQHYAPYTVNVIPPNGELDLQTITTLFDGRLDLHFAAHNHLHERYLPLFQGGTLAPSGVYGRGAEDGVGFMVVPSAGDHLWEGILTEATDEAGLLDKIAFPTFDPASGHADGEHGWVHVRTTETTMSFEVWQMGDETVGKAPYVADTVTITR